MTHRTVATLLATLLLIGTVAPAAATVAVGDGADVQAQEGTGIERAPEGPVNVTVGQQLSTVVAETDGDVRSEVEETTFELEFEDAGDDGRAGAVAERARALAERAIAIREDYQRATRAHEAGEITDSEYAARLAALNARAEDLAESVRRLRGRAAGVSAIELRAEGFTAADLRAIDERLDPVTGAGAAALLQRFAGRADGEVRIETRGGLSIEVEGKDGELSREIERPRDGDGNITVAQADALGTARAELGAPAEGRWTLERATIHDEDGYYRFEFGLAGANATGEAEVRVDGSSGAVFRLETEIEPPEGDDDDEREDGRDGDEAAEEREEDELALLLAAGTPGPNETVTLQALSAGEPVEGATVTLNGDRVGSTDANGTLDVTLPTEEAKLRAESGEAEGELEFEFDEGEREDAELRRHFDAAASVDGGTVTLRVTYDGSPVEGATVVVEDREAGTTDAGGRIEFDADGRDEFDVEVRKGAFGADLEFESRDGSLTLAEVEFADVDREERDRGTAGYDSDEPGTDEDRETAGDEESEDEKTEAPDELETETPEPTDTPEERESEFDGDLAVEIVDGVREPGATVTVEVTADGSPAADATVLLNDERVGVTDGDGRVRVTLPEEGRVEIVAEYGSEDAELEFEFEESTGGSGEAEDDDGR